MESGAQSASAELRVQNAECRVISAEGKVLRLGGYFCLPLGEGGFRPEVERRMRCLPKVSSRTARIKGGDDTKI